MRIGKEPCVARFVLSCESTIDRPRAFLEERGVSCARFHYVIDGKKYDDDLYQSVSADEFFARMAAGAAPKTRQVNAGEYEALWEPHLRAGHDVLHITLSSGISGTYNAACMAAGSLRRVYPERTVRVVDSLAASAGYGMLVEGAADRRDEGCSLGDTVAWVEANRLAVQHWFFSTDLAGYRRGGRVSAADAAVGRLLRVCPLMSMDRRGRIVVRQKPHTKGRAIKAMTQAFVDGVQGAAGYEGPCCIAHSACRADAEKVASALVRHVPRLSGAIEFDDIGPTIGSHTGPGTVALFFMGAKRVD